MAAEGLHSQNLQAGDGMNRVHISLVENAGVPDCPTCGGEGMVEETHPMWGNPRCPEPTITVLCPTCFPSRELTEVVVS